MPSRVRLDSRNGPTPTPIGRRGAVKAMPSAAGARQSLRPTWEKGYVNPRQEHFELRYGERQMPVARVGRNKSGQVLVQYLMKARVGDSRVDKMLNQVSSELTYYLFGALGSDAWMFARFHCDTPANLASQVHWRWRPAD